MSSPQPPDSLAVPGLDPLAARRWQRRSPSESPWLHEEVARRMVERLAWFRELPPSWLHWEPALGGLQAHRALRERLPQAGEHLWAQGMAQAQERLREPAKRSWQPTRWRRAVVPTPWSEGLEVGMVWANMALHHEPLPRDMMRIWHNMLRQDGFLMFSCLGPDSLIELRGVYARMGWPAPSHAFTDMHDWGDMLAASGFAEPVMDMERITLSYSSPQALLDELRGLGRNLSTARFGALRGRRWHAELCQALATQLPKDAEGRLLLTFEVIYGHAFKPQPRVPMKAEQTVSVDAMRSMLRAGRP